MSNEFAIFVLLAASSTSAGELVAHYRFDTNGNDGVGTNPPFLVTTRQAQPGVPLFFAVTNAPFTNGVLFVNGLYEPNGHFVHYLGTEPLTDLHHDSFTISLDFYPLPQKARYNPNKLEEKLDTWTRGRYSRWRGIDWSGEPQ